MDSSEALAELTGQVVLVTGGTGSFGQSIAGRLLDAGCAEVRIFSRDEAKQDAMRNRYPGTALRFHLGDVRDPDSVERAMRGVDLVFHAAALKQVPSCEFFPMEAVRTNVVGSANVIESASRHDVRAVVCLSTDKAVYPVNAMGMTKGLMEKVVLSAARSLGDGGTTISVVRYGNVMYTRGSVIPLFVSQIKAGRPITVTEPTMTRFLLPMDQAIGLVSLALLEAGQGDLFIHKSPACTMLDLASAVRNIFRADNPIRTIGIRHGEKLHETLASREELRHAEDLGLYLRLPIDSRDLDYEKYFVVGDPGESELDDFTSSNAARLSVPEVEQFLHQIPEIRAELNGESSSLGSPARFT